MPFLEVLSMETQKMNIPNLKKIFSEKIPSDNTGTNG